MMVELYAPAGCTEISLHGETIKVSKGVVKVPAESVVELYAHGFAADKPTARAKVAGDTKARAQQTNADGEE